MELRATICITHCPFHKLSDFQLPILHLTITFSDLRKLFGLSSPGGLDVWEAVIGM